MSVKIEEIDFYLKKLFPITRSITGNGNRETLKILNEIIDLNIEEYPSGMNVFDWKIPEEWNIRDAWIKSSSGKKIVDFKINNLHVLNYSTSVAKKKIQFQELNSHLYYDKEQPGSIPYKTSYYKKNWGFCLSYNDYVNLFDVDGEYEIYIDSDHKIGTLTLADYIIKGSAKKEYLFSTYFCHPSLANDNLSGVVANAFLAKALTKKTLKNSYRFIFCPETIGSITYLFNKKDEIKNSSAGFIITCVGGKNNFSYKKSFLGTHSIDLAVRSAFLTSGIKFKEYEFIPQGSDERQYSSPGFRIPMGSIHRDKYNEYKEYHTSDDNLSFISAQSIFETITLYLKVIEILENNYKFISNILFCEPKLDKYNLYPTIGRTFKSNNESDKLNELDIILWLNFYADGNHSLLEISNKLNINFDTLLKLFNDLVEKNVLSIVD